MCDRPNVLHVTADYPDPIQPQKTRAISNLVNLIGGSMENHVLSLNRKPVAGIHAWLGLVSRGFPHLEVERDSFDDGEAWLYRAPGRGLFHRSMLEQLGEAIADSVAASRRPDLIVGHKAAIEGIAVRRAAKVLGCPYMLTIQGDTDTKVLRARPDLHPALGRVFHDAAAVVSFAPWSLARFEDALGKRQGPSTVIPCATELDDVLAPQFDAKGLVTVFHLQSLRRKNLDTMVRAVRNLAGRGEPVSLGVVGGGSRAEIAAAQQVVGGTTGVSLEGPMDREAVRARINSAAAFVLPSRRESFGMVFVEALFAGCPIIYPAGCAVDGYFDGLPFAIRVPANDEQALADAMILAVREQKELKRALARWQQGGGLWEFTREAISRNYVRAVEGGLAYAASRAS